MWEKPEFSPAPPGRGEPRRRYEHATDPLGPDVGVVRGPHFLGHDGSRRRDHWPRRRDARDLVELRAGRPRPALQSKHERRFGVPRGVRLRGQPHRRLQPVWPRGPQAGDPRPRCLPPPQCRHPRGRRHGSEQPGRGERDRTAPRGERQRDHPGAPGVDPRRPADGGELRVQLGDPLLRARRGDADVPVLRRVGPGEPHVPFGVGPPSGQRPDPHPPRVLPVGGPERSGAGHAVDLHADWEPQPGQREPADRRHQRGSRRRGAGPGGAGPMERSVPSDAVDASPGDPVVSLNDDLLTPVANRPTWDNPNPGHSAVPFPGRPFSFITDEVYGTFTDDEFGCPWGWARTLLVAQPGRPRIMGEYLLPENSCPAPTQADQERAAYTSHNPTLTRNLALVTWHSGGFQAIDIEDPAHMQQGGWFSPTPLAAVANEDPALGMGTNKVVMWSFPIVSDGLIYVVDIRNGLYILRYTGPRSSEVSGLSFLEGNSNLGDAVRLAKSAG